MEAEKSSWKRADKIVFIEYSSNKPGQHFMTVMKNVDGKRRIIGRIFREYDPENKKTVYTARDWAGNPVFQDIPDLTSLKKSFIEHSKTLALTIPKDPARQKETELSEEEDRRLDLKEIREQKTGKEQERKLER